MIAESTPGVLFVLPAYGGRTAAIDAAAITSADFAEALGEYLGGAEMLTPDGLCSPTDVRADAVRSTGVRSPLRNAFARLPQWSRVALSDVRDWRRAAAMRRLVGTVASRGYRLVVQLHGRYDDCGRLIAQACGAPFVLRLEALEVREEASWGVLRPGWGRLVERRELNTIRRVDVVASVSQDLDDQLRAENIRSSHRVVIPNGVDVSVFSPGEPDASLRATHRLEKRFVVGWVGGFRPFHGLEMIPSIARGLREQMPRAAICLVGAGPERDSLANRISGMEDMVRILDPVAHDEIPRWLSSFDACLLLAGRGGFHYSPMKLYEYLACGRPVVAAGVGQVADVLVDGRNGLVVAPGDPDAVVSSLVRLAGDPGLRSRLGTEARRTALEEASWDQRARSLIEFLVSRALLPAGTLSSKRQE